MIREAATDDTNIIFGATIDDRLTGQIWITVVATGLGGTRRRRGLASAGLARERRPVRHALVPARISARQGAHG